MPEDPLSIHVDPTPSSRRAGKSNNGGPTGRQWAVAAVAGIVGLLIAGLWWLNSRDGAKAPAEGASAGAAVSQASPGDAEAAQEDARGEPVGAEQLHREEIVADDGQLLWASPTAGEPLALDWVPDGTQLLVHLRLGELLAHSQWEKLAAGLGPWGDEAQRWLRRVTGSELDELETVLVAVAVLPTGEPGLVVRATLATPWDVAELARRFPQSKPLGGVPERRVSADHCYVLSDPAGRTLAIYPASLVGLPEEPAADAPMLVRDLERLLGESDRQRHATIVFAPRFLEAGGAKLLGDEGRKLRSIVRRLFEDQATAAAMAMHLDDRLFLEIVAIGTSITPPRRLALTVAQQIRDAASDVEELLLAQDWPAYGKKVLIRLPSMLRQLARFTRVAAEEKRAVIRCYLPAVAAHNLVTAGELLLSLRTGEIAQAATPAQGRTMDERLAQPTSLVFSKETLENSLIQLSEAINVPITIAGSDLQLSGITKNQSLALDLRDRPAVEILQQIVRRANPDQAADGLDDPRQQLVYVISRDAGGQDRIIVTTRTAAAARGDRLPEVFVLPEE